MHRLAAMGKVLHPHIYNRELQKADGKTALQLSWKHLKWLLQQQHLQTKISAFKLTEAGTVEPIIVASLMKINDWRKPHHSTALISHESSTDYICIMWVHVCPCVLTTSRMSLLTSKLGFFFVLRMTQLWTTVPPHSTCRLGEFTLAIWKLFRLRTPHAKIWQGAEEEM